MNLRPILFVATCIALSPLHSFAQEQDCKFKYWEVIPNTTSCEVFELPDFQFKRLPSTRSEDDPLRKFCSEYEIISAFGKQIASYCSTGRGDRFGPAFRLGDSSWNYSDKAKTDRIYVADLSFTGCLEGKDTKGIVFIKYGWSKAPKFIQRALPVQGVKLSCKSL